MTILTPLHFTLPNIIVLRDSQPKIIFSSVSSSMAYNPPFLSINWSFCLIKTCNVITFSESSLLLCRAEAIYQHSRGIWEVHSKYVSLNLFKEVLNLLGKVYHLAFCCSCTLYGNEQDSLSTFQQMISLSPPFQFSLDTRKKFRRQSWCFCRTKQSQKQNS